MRSIKSTDEQISDLQNEINDLEITYHDLLADDHFDAAADVFLQIEQLNMQLIRLENSC